MPPSPEQPSPVSTVPTPVTVASIKISSTAIKIFRIFLLVLIIIGLGLIATQNLWVPNLVSKILQNQTIHAVPNIATQNSAKGVLVWIPLSTEEATLTPEYIQSGSNVIWNSDNRPIISNDAGDFQVAAHKDNTGITYLSFAKDKNEVFWLGQILQNADPSTFTVFGYSCDDRPGYKECLYYEKDRASVWDWNSNLIKNADPSTFMPLSTSAGEDTKYAVDKQNVFSGGSILANADPLTFHLLNDSFAFAGDGKKVYAYGNLIPQADVGSFTTLNYPGGISDAYAKDRNNVYYCLYDSLNNVQIIKGADPATFVVIDQLGSDEYTYAKDKNHIYFDESVLSAADLGTFTVHSGYSDGVTYDAQDKNHKYFQGQIVQ